MGTINEFHLLVNPTSGSGKGKRIGEKIQLYLEQKGKTVHLHESQYAGHTTKIAAELAQHIQSTNSKDHLIVVIGGDGTIHQALMGLSEEYAAIPLGFVPSGSGNDFARGIGISLDPKEAVNQILAAEQSTEIDVLRFWDETTQRNGYAVNNIGLGLDASIIKEVNQSTSKRFYNKLKLSKLTYLSAVLSHFIKQPPFPLTVNMDEHKHSFQHAFLVTTNNHPYFGSGINISPKADPTDGTLDLIVVERISSFQFLRLFLIVFTNGKHLEDSLVNYFTGKQLRLTVPSAVDGQADGETLGAHSYDMTIQTVKRRFWF